MINIDIFNNDERILINKGSQGFTLKEFTRQRFLDNLKFALNITVDPMIANLVDELKTKVMLLSEDEWNALTLKLPLKTLYDAETNVDEPPLD